VEVAASETGVILPPGVHEGRIQGTPGAGERVIIDNRTDLPDDVVEGAVMDHFVESASMAWGNPTTFQTYAGGGGSMLARRSFITPANVIDEIKLARNMAERDDDVGSCIGQALALALGDGMEHQHKDEKTKAIFDVIAREADMDATLAELYRELLISSQINTAVLFTRETIDYTLYGSDRTLHQSVAMPLIGVIPAEQIRVIGNDMFGTATLAYEPDDERLRRWLDEFFDPSTSAARKHAMALEDRVAANMFTGIVQMSALDQDIPPVTWGRLYTLNPRMVQRSTFPKGSWKYPRPLMTRDFALLEAKRLLNIMDYALLQGGSNFIVVAKKGSDQRPATAGEVQNLESVVRSASRSGVIVGDHRLSFEIITPKLDELLNPAKRKMLGRKLSMAMLRLTEHDEESGGGQGVQADTEVLARVVTYDRRIVRRHVENKAYYETVKRNPNVFKQGPACIWFPKIILQGTQFFTDLILKLRDRGDIPRAWGVQVAGFDWDAAVQQRKREVESGDDEVMQPGAVPHSSPNAPAPGQPAPGPQDNGPGRPPGSRDGQGRGQLQRPTRVIQRNAGETVRAWYEDEAEMVVRMGESTEAVLEQYPDRSIGRVTGTERNALALTEVAQIGATIYVPVNPEYETINEKAVRLGNGLSMIVGERRTDSAIVAKVIGFREPEFDETAAENFCVRWGFPTRKPEPDPDPAVD